MKMRSLTNSSPQRWQPLSVAIRVVDLAKPAPNAPTYACSLYLKGALVVGRAFRVATALARGSLQAPHIPAGPRHDASRVQFDLRQGWEITFDHLAKGFGFLRVASDRREEQRRPLRSHSGRRDMAARSDQQNLVLVAKPVSSSDPVLAPHYAGFVDKWGASRLAETSGCGN